MSRPRRARPPAPALLLALTVVGAVASAQAGPADVDPGAATEARAELGRLLAACPPEAVAGRLDLARWARGQGLAHEAIDLLHDVLDRQPLDRDAYDLLVEMQDRHPLRSDSAALAAARDLLPRRFASFESRRFIVLSDADARWTQQQAELLERSWHQFRRFARHLDLAPRPLRHKLVCVLFQHQDDYQQFALEHDGVTAAWMDGYYSPKFDRVVFFHVAGPQAGRGAGPCAVRRALCASPAGPSRGRRTAQSAQPADAALGALGGAATTVHEAVHQLMFHTRLQSPRVQYPLWICEGLATAFETDHPNRAFGPDQETTRRRRQFLKLLETEALLPLRELVHLTAVPDAGGDVVHAVYNQSYALVTWLSRFRRAELRRYLDAMRTEPAGRPDPARHLELFESAFGDVDRLEAAWLGHERGR